MALEGVRFRHEPVVSASYRNKGSTMATTSGSADSIVENSDANRPHPLLPRYYKTDEDKRRYLTAIFDATVADYDKLESWLSLGSGRKYRRDALLRAGIQPGMHIADVAVGTGLVAAEALSIIGEHGSLVGIDPSTEMLRSARERLGIRTIVATAESLPLESESMDAISMGYALRHVESLDLAFQQFHRVLKRGGRVCILEITRPRTSVGRWILKAYLGTLTNILGKVIKLSPRTPELWAYYGETIDKCVPPEQVLKALGDAGFVHAERQTSCGILSEYTALKP